jgi:phosphotriesterase-related protein
MRLDDLDLVRAEIEEIRAARPAIIDVTPVDIGRSPSALRALAEQSDLQIFMGSGRYVESARTGEALRDPGFYRDEIIRDLLEGVDGVRAAVIGEIGTSTPITNLEEATLRGATQAQRETGAPLLIHVDLWNPSAHEALDIVEQERGDLSRTVVCHLDCSLLVREIDYHLGVLQRGAYLAFDTWGDELRYAENQQPTDTKRLDTVLALVDRGFGDRLLHSHDICTKTQLRRFGGPGYAHIPNRLFPSLHARGLSLPDVDTLFVAPARRLLGADR